MERVVVANADQLVIVSALADPPPRTGFIDRCLVAAYDADIEPLLCLTKADLAGPEAVLDYYAELDLPHVLCRPDRPTSTSCASALAGRVSVLVGHSGRGQVDAGQPARAGRRPGGRRGQRDRQGPAHLDQRGRAAAARQRRVGWIVDTPGVRSFGLAHVVRRQPAARLPRPGRGHRRLPAELRPHRRRRRLRAGRLVAAGSADARRLASFRRLLASRAGDPTPRRPTGVDRPDLDVRPGRRCASRRRRRGPSGPRRSR